MIDRAREQPGSTGPGPAISIDLRCRQCDYNLRGLRPGGKCPECGTAIEVSIRGDTMCYSDPRWLRRIAVGLRCEIWALGIRLLCLLAPCVLMDKLSPFGWFQAGLLLSAGGLLGAYGAWTFTAPEPGEVAAARFAADRRAVRVCAPLAVLLFAAIVITLFAQWSWSGQPVMIAAIVTAAFAELAALFAKLRYLENLAGRVPAADLARRARRLRWMFVILPAAIVIAGVVGSVVQPVSFLIIPGAIMLLGLMVGPMDLYYRLAQALDVQAAVQRSRLQSVPRAVPAGTARVEVGADDAADQSARDDEKGPTL